jgi:hypothetical protein
MTTLTPQPTLAAPRFTRLERDSPLYRLAAVVEVLALRYPDVPMCVVREQVVDVLSLAEPGRAVPALVMRLVEARLWAMS